jgi:uncharacterized protein DUF3108
MPCSGTNKPASLWLLFCAFGPLGLPQTSLPAKETLHYTIEWRLITAGKAQLAWSANPRASEGWQARMHLESTGLVSKLFKVSDEYTSTLNADLCAIGTLLDAQEGRRHRETKVSFDAQAKKASYLERDLVKNTVENSQQTDIPPCVHDVFGGLYLLRTLRLEPGQSAQVPMSDGKKSVSARVEAQQRETIRTPAGTFRTIRYEAFLFNDVLYRRPAHLYVWLSDDRRCVPVQIRVKLQFAIGTITLLLEKEEL